MTRRARSRLSWSIKTMLLPFVSSTLDEKCFHQISLLLAKFCYSEFVRMVYLACGRWKHLTTTFWCVVHGHFRPHTAEQGLCGAAGIDNTWLSRSLPCMSRTDTWSLMSSPVISAAAHTYVLDFVPRQNGAVVHAPASFPAFGGGGGHCLELLPFIFIDGRIVFVSLWAFGSRTHSRTFFARTPSRYICDQGMWPFTPSCILLCGEPAVNPPYCAVRFHTAHMARLSSPPPPPPPPRHSDR